MTNTPKPKDNTVDEQAYENTDVELWREPQQDGKVDYYSNSIHRTDRGGIGINVGGSVHEMTLEEWHKLAQPAKPQGNTLDEIRDSHTMKLVPLSQRELFWFELEPKIQTLIAEAIANERKAITQAMLDALPEKLSMKPAIQTHSDAGAGTVIGFNQAIDQMETAIKLIGGSDEPR